MGMGFRSDEKRIGGNIGGKGKRRGKGGNSMR
jgi:hypothetical protein